MVAKCHQHEGVSKLMGIGQTVVMGVLLVVLIVLSIGIMEMVFPMMAHYEFQKLCRTYALLVESNNGMDGALKSEWLEGLKAQGIKEVWVEAKAPDDVKRKDLIEIYVSGKYDYKAFKTLFERESKRLDFEFKAKVLARKVLH